MKQALLTLILIFNLSNVFSQNDCEKCEIEKAKVINNNLDQLDFKLVSDFLCTFDEACKTVVEYSEWSNETLYTILERNPALVLSVLEKIPDHDLILINIQNPVHDGFNYQSIFNKISDNTTSTEIQKKILESLIIAAEKEGIEIE
ncbi:hypothetical protein [Robertkochia aurantiaca]|uniref:hypothetical protein n=1 Tax=Robertkochia aurantiaca TaxID=2873700 RepID=UPI001CCE2EAB|nr:hypothetical protein [Robertkochia sp. 3YJGBD-33]